MVLDIKVRKEVKADFFQREMILDDCFGKDRNNRTVYIYRKIPPIKELSLISYLKQEPKVVIGTIRFYRVLIEQFHCLLLGPLAVDKHYQGKGFGKKLIQQGLNLAKENGEKICFVSGEYDYYCHYGFKKLSSIKLNIIVPGPISFNDLLIYEFNNDAKNYLKNNSQLSPLN